MNNINNFKKFISVEIKKINIDKWIEGEKRHSDPGQEYTLFWIKEKAEEFRTSWDNSKCKTCIFCCDCGHNILSACENYKNE
jgi:hypothetical protein